VNLAFEEGKAVQDRFAVLGCRFELAKNKYQVSGRTNVAQSFGTGKLFVLVGFNRSMGHMEPRFAYSYVEKRRAFGGLDVTADTWARQAFRPLPFQVPGFQIHG